MKNPLASMLPQSFRRRIPSAFESFQELENEMERWYRHGVGEWPDEFQRLEFFPACNITENNQEYILHFDIPGMTREELKIEVQDGRITVAGERKEKQEEKDGRHFLVESHYGAFMRTFNLPTAVDENKVKAQYDDGVLTIRVPKLETSKAKEIKIH